MTTSFEDSVSAARQALAAQAAAAEQQREDRFSQQFPTLLATLRQGGIRCHAGTDWGFTVHQHSRTCVINCSPKVTPEAVLVCVADWSRRVRRSRNWNLTMIFIGMTVAVAALVVAGTVPGLGLIEVVMNRLLAGVGGIVGGCGLINLLDDAHPLNRTLTVLPAVPAQTEPEPAAACA